MKKEQKLVWITGASSGIGAALAQEMVGRGYRVAITARSIDKLDAVAEGLEGIRSYAGDITNAAAMEKIVSKIENDLGHIDIAVLNAGSYVRDTAKTFSIENFENHINLNLIGTIKSLAPIMNRFRERKGGHVAIVSSVAGMRGLPGSLSYGASKGALINFTEALYMELKPYDVKVQLVNPGFVKTPLTDKNKFEMPMLMPVDKAAKAFADGLESHKFEITFPWAFVFMKKIIDLLPNKIYLWLIGKAVKES